MSERHDHDHDHGDDRSDDIHRELKRINERLKKMATQADIDRLSGALHTETEQLNVALAQIKDEIEGLRNQQPSLDLSGLESAVSAITAAADNIEAVPLPAPTAPGQPGTTGTVNPLVPGGVAETFGTTTPTVTGFNPNDPSIPGAVNAPVTVPDPLPVHSDVPVPPVDVVKIGDPGTVGSVDIMGRTVSDSTDATSGVTTRTTTDPRTGKTETTAGTIDPQTKAFIPSPTAPRLGDPGTIGGSGQTDISSDATDADGVVTRTTVDGKGNTTVARGHLVNGEFVDDVEKAHPEGNAGDTADTAPANPFNPADNV